MRYWWEARAEYADGTSIDRTFPFREDMDEDEQQYQLECWLIERNKDCTWYTVNFVCAYDDEYEED